MVLADVSIGVAGTLGPEAIATLAPAVERAGFHGLWVNDLPGGDSLAALHAVAPVTGRLALGTGVVPVDRRDAASILAASSGLPASRLRIGIGSGASRSPLGDVGAAIDELRAGGDAAVYVGALGPRMRLLAAERADGILLNWLTPAVAAQQADEAHALAPQKHVALYVRTAVHEDAVPRLAQEADRYSGYPSYKANFDRLGIRALDTTLDPATFAGRIAAYRDAVDEVVLRVITVGDTLDEHLDFVDRAAELLRDQPG